MNSWVYILRQIVFVEEMKMWYQTIAYSFCVVGFKKFKMCVETQHSIKKGKAKCRNQFGKVSIGGYTI